MSFKKSDRGINHFLFLKKDYYSHKERLANSLPQFVRTMFIDQSPVPWVNEINRFDFLDLVNIDPKIGTFVELKPGVALSLNICPKEANSESVTINEFLRIKIVSINGRQFNVQEFAQAIAYTGGIHQNPTGDKADEVELIYSSILAEMPEISLKIIEQIAKCFIDVFEEYYTMFMGDKNAHASNKNFQPKIVENGIFLDGSLFKKAYLQVPIRAKKNRGVRVSLELKFIDSNLNENMIFAYGHRKKDSLNFRLIKNKEHLIVNISYNGERAFLKTKIEDHLFNTFNLIEICIYPNGTSILGLNGFLKDTSNLNSNIQMEDGKLILGTDLDGSNFGIFFNKLLIIQSIDQLNNFRVQNAYWLSQPRQISGNMPANLLQRGL